VVTAVPLQEVAVAAVQIVGEVLPLWTLKNAEGLQAREAVHLMEEMEMDGVRMAGIAHDLPMDAVNPVGGNHVANK